RGWGALHPPEIRPTLPAAAPAGTGGVSAALHTETDHAPGYAHLTLCVDPDGRVDFFPQGDAAQVERALRLVLRTFAEHPEAIRCAAGTCDGGCGHAVRRG